MKLITEHQLSLCFVGARSSLPKTVLRPCTNDVAEPCYCQYATLGVSEGKRVNRVASAALNFESVICRGTQRSLPT